LVVSASFFFHSVLKSISWPVVSQSVSWSVGYIIDRMKSVGWLVARSASCQSVRWSFRRSIDCRSVFWLVCLSIGR
jgi:hypothetical protein